jgi:xanthine dehydrogenase YagS FAD-binding subunit
MNLFSLVRPATVAEATAAAAKPDAVYYAGGSNLVDLMKLGVARPEALIDLSRLTELGRIEWLPDGAVRIGATVRNADLAYDARFARTYPMVAEALLSGASAQLRNVATTGGNLMQETRCAYFQDAASICNRRTPGAGCDALHGENRLHAVLGWSDHCVATHPSEFAVPLAALGAVVELAGPEGRRETSVEALYRLPDGDTARATSLAPGELIVAVRLPPEAAGFANHARYLKLRERTSFAFALVSAAAALRFEEGKIAEARLALGGVAAKPWRAREAEASLAGANPSQEAFQRAANLALADARPSGDNAFKIELARRILARALAAAAAGTPERTPAVPGSPFSTTPGARHVA